MRALLICYAVGTLLIFVVSTFRRMFAEGGVPLPVPGPSWSSAPASRRR